MAEARAPVARPMSPRPMSPHLGIYRWTWTMAMSVFHRGTGIALTAGTVLLAVWLMGIAAGPVAYDRVGWFFGSIIGRLIMFGYTWALMHHMLGGVRHLVWDTGIGFEPGTRIAMARWTLIGSSTLTVLIWIVAAFLR